MITHFVTELAVSHIIIGLLYTRGCGNFFPYFKLMTFTTAVFSLTFVGVDRKSVV